MLSKEQEVEECDATDDDSSTEAGNTIATNFIKELKNKKTFRPKFPL
jgi:hypothetical protein